MLLSGLLWKETTVSRALIAEHLDKKAAIVSNVIHRMDLSQIQVKVSGNLKRWPPKEAENWADVRMPRNGRSNVRGRHWSKADRVVVRVLVCESEFCKSLIIRVVGPEGFEPSTSSTRTRRSTKLSHGPILC